MSKKVYLAGGFYAKIGEIDWQTYITSKRNIKNSFTFLNPKDKERGKDNKKLGELFKNPKVYTTWDLEAIKASDYVFAYIDKGNPAVGVIAEVGYAVGLNKPVILVIDPETPESYHKDKYFDFLRAMPNVVYFRTVDEGCMYLMQVTQF